MLKKLILLFYLWNSFVFSQANLNAFLKPTDSLNKARRNGVYLSEVAIGGITLLGLNQLWYADYPKSNFHTINDNNEWLQMDKMGHAFSTYNLGRFGAEALKWSGASRKNQLIYGSTLGFSFMTVVEVFDGYSSNWGFSWGDMIANFSGTLLYVSQDLLWNEQRIVPKFSFHNTEYASARPAVLGSNLQEQILKDYNGQTYWLSGNVHSFFKKSKIPTWLNLAVGYGAKGMITGQEALVNTVFFPDKQRTRVYYLSFDVDLTKIKTKSHFLKTVCSLFNTVKIPAPTFQMDQFGKAEWYFLYF
ncbi:MAG: DUF2279 domain-containing protein [Flavobacterium sp.]|nr:DUF2279 domain-containing protein [Flavobacterium sp.]